MRLFALFVASLLGSAGCREPPVPPEAPRETRAEAPPPAPLASAAAAPVATDAAPEPDRARRAAEVVLARLAEKSFTDVHLDPGPPAPECKDGRCTWVFEGSGAYGGERSKLATLYVDDGTLAVAFEPNDGTGKRWEPDAYVKYRASAERAVNAVLDLPEVKRWCAAIEKKGVRCTLWLDSASEVACPAQPRLGDECLFGVYLGEVQPGYATRAFTVFVVPETWSVLGASGIECDRLSLKELRQHLSALARGQKTPKCASMP